MHSDPPPLPSAKASTERSASAIPQEHQLRRRFSRGANRDRAAVAEAVPGASRLNNFDALRLLAALSVVVSHSFAIAGNPQPAVGAMDLGTIGVVVFFGVSGFLITQSWITDPHLWRFAAKRALRILPALIVVLLVTTLVIGPLVSSLSPSAYLAQAGTWAYLIQNTAMITTGELPGVFTDLPYPRQVNAVLWTLQAEVIAYICVAIVGLVGLLRTKWFVPLATVVLVVAPHGLVPWTRELFMLQAFAVGASLYLMREHVPWHAGLAAIGLLAWSIAPEGLQLLLAVGVIPYATIFVAYRGPTILRRLTARGDYSYGIYLLGWPIGQVVALLFGSSVTTAIVLGVSAPITYLLAMASWTYIEKPALGLKKHLRGRHNEPRVVGGLDLAARRHQVETRAEVGSG